MKPMMIREAIALLFVDNLMQGDADETQ